MIHIADVNKFILGLPEKAVVNVKIPGRETGCSNIQFRAGRARILKVYPFVTLTTRGTYRNIDLYLWNNGGK